MKKVLSFLLALLVFGFAAAPVSAQNTLTVADGTETNAYVPIYGYWADAAQHNQVIYPESMLTDMLNYAITEMTFYLSSSPSNSTWGSATFNVKLGITTDSSFASASYATATFTEVFPASGIQISSGVLTFEFETPFVYTGGNLLFDLTSTSGTYSSANFYGIVSNGGSINQYSSNSPTMRDFIPKTTFSYGTPSLCAKPTNVTATNITTTGATISWTGDDNASSYNIEYMLSSETDWTNAMTATSSTNTVDLYNLSPSSSYKVRVQTACSDNTETNWSSVCSFMTGCDALTITETVPWFENFEGYQGGGEQPFQCWATPVTSSTYGSPFVYCGHAPACHSGANSAELKGSSGDVNLLVLPEFTNDIHDLRLSFWATATSPSYGTLQIGVLADMDDLTSFEELALSGTPSSRDGVGNYIGPFDFNGIQATSGRIALRFTSNSYNLSWNLDDFTVELSPSCTSPVKTSVTASNIDGHNATISFVDNDDNHNSWTLYYKMDTETDNDWQSVTLYDTAYTLTGLTPETTYNVYVVTNCGGTPGTDATITYNFTTSVACPAPTAVTASPVYINDATITWTSTATVFNIEYGETGFSQGTGTTETVYDNTITLNNLNAQTSYTVYVQADCSGDNDGLSQWASVQFTTLPSCPAPTQVAANNITSNSADIVWTAGYQESEWELRYGPENFNPDTSSVSEIISGTALFQMQNLPADTRYDIYVRAICSATDSSAWSSRLTFKTQCEAATLPLTEDFENVSDWGTPTCWQKFESPNMSGWAAVRNENAYSGSKSLHVEGNYNATSYGFMRLPNLDVDDISTLQVKLMARKSSGSRELIVGIIPEFFSVDSIYVAGSFTDLTSDYTEKIVSFEDFPGTTGYIIIGTPAGIGSSSVFNVDNITVEVRPNCMYPTNFSVDSVGETAVVLSWTELGTAESWNIEYGPMGYTQGTGTSVTATDSTVYMVENLSESTAYDFYVQSDCGSLGSDWVGPLTVVTSQYNFGTTGSDTITTCGMSLYDDGGANGNYSTSCDYTLVVNPATDGSGISITGTVNTYNSSSYYAGVLTIYAGVGTAGDVLGTFSGNQTVNVANSGPVTIHFTSGSYYTGAGFELIAQCTDCYPPTNVTLSNITMTGVTVDWSGSASEYAVYAMSATDTVYATTTDTSYTFTTLTSSSTYKVCVRSLCGSDSSLLSPMVTFNTACDLITVTDDTPWTENFEGYAGGGERPFVCWETPVTDATYHGPFVYCGYSQSCHSGSNSAEFKGGSNLLVLPDFSNDIHDLRLSFWATATSTSIGTVEVGVVTDILDPNSFEVVVANAGAPGQRGNQDGVSGNGNYMGPFDFNGVQATSGRIALRYTSSSPSQSWNLDDFTVELTPNCPSPVKTSVQASNIDGHNATITFTDNDPSHNSWTVYYKESTDSVWNSEITNSTSVDLTNLDPETAYDVYVVTNCTTPDIVEDATMTIHFTTTVACPAPTNVTVSNIGMTSATVTWSGNADSYTVTCGTFTTTVTGNTADITGLTSGTTYSVSVTADCGADGTSQPATTSFNTANCEVADQCTYTFNLTDSYGDGWNGGSLAVQQNGVTVVTLGLSSGSSATETVNLCDNVSTSLVWTSGSFAYEAGFSITGPDGTVLFSHDSMSTYTTYTFTTDCSGSGPAITDPTVVTNPATNVAQTTATLNGTITNPDNVTITTQGFEWKVSTAADYTVVNATGNAMTYNLTNLTENTAYTYRAFITFNGTTVYGNDETFTTLQQGQAQEPSATTAAATAITQTTATLNGSIANPDNVTITTQGFEWKTTTGGTYTAVNATGSTMTYNLTGLTAATDYTYRAFVTTANGTHYGSELTFTTLDNEVEPCNVPTGLTVGTVTHESIAISWDNDANVGSWNIQYRPVGGTLASATSTTNSYTITGLTPETEYEIQVQADCGDGNVSDWSAAVTATTTTGIENHLLNSISLYPNPAKEYIDVRVDEFNVTNMEVFDVYGKLISTVNVIDNPTRINVSNLASGMYFVRVTTEQGVVTKSFVKK